MPDGSKCTGTRRSSKPWTGPGSRDGKIALCHGHNTHFIKYGEPRTDIPLRAMMPMTFEERVEHYMCITVAATPPVATLIACTC